MSEESNINVAVRCRPMSQREIRDGHQSIVEFEGSNKVIVHNIQESPSDQLGTKSGERQNFAHEFEFSSVFDWNSSQQEVYDRVCRPIVDSVLEGYNGTIFAYGQTGTGKTYTMEGANCCDPLEENREDKQKNANKSTRRDNSGARRRTTDKSLYDETSSGVIPRAFKQIFKHISETSNAQFLIRASYLEIYQEEIHDLLKRDRSVKLELHERPDIGIYVKDLTSFVCKSMTEIERVMRVGNQNRMVGATDMNEHSSRSHAIFMVTIEQQSTICNSLGQAREDCGGKAALMDGNNNSRQIERVIRVGKLNLVDLAGCERQRKTNSFGQRQRESIKINLSLSALGNVINALMRVNGQKQEQQSSEGEPSTSSFIPYRDSKLTRLLQDSLGGNARTLMIANIGPASYNYDETINTLNYASRAKCIRNRPRLNEDPKDALLRELQREINDLRCKLAKISKIKHNADQLNRKPEVRDERPDPSKFDGDKRRVEEELVELKQKLASLESKLLNGNRSGDVLDPKLLKGYTQEQELALERSRAELADQANRERAIRDELERREEAELSVRESFDSIQQEIEAKRRLIRQILIKTKQMRDELDTTQGAYSVELNDLDQSQYLLHKELKLKCLIMDNFVPNDHVDQLLKRIEFDEKRNCCSLKPIILPSNFCTLNDELQPSDWLSSSEDCLRLRSEFERIGETIYPGNIRFKCENLIEPKLDFPRHLPISRKINLAGLNEEPTDELSPRRLHIQTLINSSLSKNEPDIVI